MRQFLSRRRIQQRYAKKLIRSEYYGSVSSKDVVPSKAPVDPGYIWAPYVPVLYEPWNTPWYKRLFRSVRRWYLLKTGKLVPVKGTGGKHGNICYY